MKIKRKIIQLLINMVWVLLASGVTVLLIAAIDIKNHKTCPQVIISIRGAKNFLFLNNRDVVQLVSQNGIGYPVGKPIAACNLQSLQALLEKNVWVKEAQLFFDNNFVLHIVILEREPVARVFDRDGKSFYIDSSGYSIPLGNKRMVVQLPVFTGFPVTGEGDSLLLRQINLVSQYILQTPFWKAQIAQIDITPQKTFEMVPTFGDHLIKFGDAENYAAKFDRLALFYKKVLKEYGFNRYSSISVEYKDQVIGTKRGTVSRIDSLQALKNIQHLIEESKKIIPDSAPTAPGMVKEISPVKKDSVITRRDKNRVNPKPVNPVKGVVKPTKPAAPKKTVSPASHATDPKINTGHEKPKAVMPKQQ